MGQNVEYAFDRTRAAGIDARDTSLANGRGHDRCIGEIRNVELAGISGGAGYLGAAVDAGGGSADGGCHDGYLIFLTDWICGVAFAACVSVRRMARRARPILKALWE